MNIKIAEQISDALNAYNLLNIELTPEMVLEKAENYIYLVDSQENLIGAVKYTKINWYLGTIAHLTILPEHRKKGNGYGLLKKAEDRARENNLGVLQATIIEDNVPSIRCFEKIGYGKVNCFLNIKTERKIYIYQKILTPC